MTNGAEAASGRDRPAGKDAGPGRREATLSAVCCALLLALPFAAVTLPPITDLPQQSAQIRLLFEALEDPGSEYRIQWWHPNKLGYLPLLVAWLLLPPLVAGKWGLLLIGWSWVLAIHVLAVARRRPLGAAIAGTILFLNHITYWGFLNFLVGLPCFVLWLLLLGRGDSGGWRRGPVLLASSLLLYSAHVLWLASGLLWLALRHLLERRPPRQLLLSLAWTSPVLLLVAFWYPSLARGGFESATTYGQSFAERLSIGWLKNTALGGLEGPGEGWLLLALLGWVGLGLIEHRASLAASVDRRLLLLGLLFFLAAFTLPGVRQHTIFLHSRWVPPACLFLLLALPAPRLGPAPLRIGVPLLLVASHSLMTLNSWGGFERRELSGLERALVALPEQPRLLGLDLVRRSPRIRDFPYYHLYAYGQVLRGGVLNRSFASQASSLVVFRDLPQVTRWTPGLDWRPQRLRESDLDYFDHLLLFAESEMHDYFLSDPRVEAVTPADAWRLYRVSGGTSDEAERAGER